MRWSTTLAVVLVVLQVMCMAPAATAWTLPDTFVHPPLPAEPQELKVWCRDNPYVGELKVAKEQRSNSLRNFLAVEKNKLAGDFAKRHAYDAFIEAHNRYAKLVETAIVWDRTHQSYEGRVLAKALIKLEAVGGAVMVLESTGPKIAIYPPPPSRSYRTTTLKDGSFFFSKIEADSYKLTIEKDGYAPFTRNIGIIKGGHPKTALYLVKLLVPLASFNGQVLAGNGDRQAPVMRADVALIPRDTISSPGTPTAASYKTSTLKDGTFALERLPLGSYEVTVNKTGYYPYRSKLVLKAGQNPARPYYLTQMGTLSGTVLAIPKSEWAIRRLVSPTPGTKCSVLMEDFDATYTGKPEPLAGARVVLAVENSRLVAVTDKEGHYKISGVPKGTGEFTVSSPGLCPFRGKLDLSGQDQKQDVVLLWPYLKTCRPTPTGDTKQAEPIAAPSGSDVNRPFEP